MLHLCEEGLLHELHARPEVRLRLRPGDLRLQHELLLREVMFAALTGLLADCCTSLDGMCSCFPCSCITCCCVYSATTLTAVLAVLGVVRVAVRKDGVEIVGGDEKSRAEIAALLAKAHYEVKSLSDEVWRFGDAEVQVARQTVRSADGVVSRLTGKEMKILRLFASDPTAVISREAMLSDVWGLRYWGTTRTVDQHIAQLRRKLGVELVSVRGVGYRMEIRAPEIDELQVMAD